MDESDNVPEDLPKTINVNVQWCGIPFFCESTTRIKGTGLEASEL
jgi:hypothetical protein